MTSILIIDDDHALCRSLQVQLELQGHKVSLAHCGADGLAAFGGRALDLVLLDLKLPDTNGIEVLRALQEKNPDVPVVMITGQQDTNATIEAMRCGAFDYLRKPFDIDSVLLVIEKVQRLKARSGRDGAEVKVEASSDAANEIIGSDRKIVEVVKQIGLLSRSRVTVLIEGESGTGKELVARILHEAGSPGKPFVAINCSAVVPTLLESELFGHEKGAFTGAVDRKLGKLEYADEGTLFFDEIGDMPLDLQSKILRVLQEREFERVGGLEAIPFKARAIAATHRDLNALVSENRFRQDLYYRLAVSQIVVPPLRERRGDIRPLVVYLVSRIACRLHRQIDAIETQAMQRLEAYDWPGNVRELENVLTRAIALARGTTLAVDDLEFSIGPRGAEAPAPSAIVPLQQVEKEHVRRALISTGWNITQTAKLLEISPTTLRKKIADYDLQERQ